ncbi:uncharacterized protein BX663DRAFT_428424 [Cokeromyces recurvatus]|uniref:uncharacterized protein n=1 Tax=Cokeromyces recurvatus TaxID=90255 RepID=UPI00221EE461|nr:uncharacterized protein BX663DRAFT_428424 [Cokeromyces recurvatus]KAI7906252.1 hypothetical protein BX663DRAFT_428424 [Cokeromyces recurvatus]
MPMDQLYDHLGWLTTPKDFDSICQLPTPGHLSSYTQRSKCAEYHQFAAISWNDLHDFSPLSPYIRIRFQNTISFRQLQADLKVTDAETYIHYDEHLYDWRLYEDLDEARAILQNGSNFVDSFTDRKFYKIFTPAHWQDRKERLLHLGGVFGSTRINMIRPEHIELQQRIAETLQYRLDMTPLAEAVKGIVQHLGGKATYNAIHFRLKDLPFRKYAMDNLHQFERNMSIATGIEVPPLPPYNEFGILTASPKPPNKPKYPIRLRPQHDLTLPPWSNWCQSVSPNLSEPTHIGSRAMVYIATDHKDIRGENSRILEWFDYFPCTLTLNDIPDSLFEPLNKMHCLFNTNKPLRPYLIPLVDAMVAAHARRIFTTPRSTFSKYIGELNEAWVLKEQGYNLSSFYLY